MRARAMACQWAPVVALATASERVLAMAWERAPAVAVKTAWEWDREMASETAEALILGLGQGQVCCYRYFRWAAGTNQDNKTQ